MEAAQKAVLTGAAGEIGRALTQQLIDQGARVIGVDVNESGLADLANSYGDAFSPIVADLGDEASLSECCQQITKDHGTIDVLINNAGIVTHSKFLETTLQDLRYAMTLNFESAYLMSQKLIPGMIDAKRGRIINVSSFAGRSGGLLAGTAYSLSKSAMIGLTFSLAREFGPKGISVNAVAPAFVRSEMMSSAFKNPQDEVQLVAAIPLRRLCDPDEVASTIAYLASAPAGFINGEVVDINGGIQCD
ncbi:MAG: SDR family NAD(P)-dependent oxidoreductase [Pseudomonadota bacterium]